MTNEPITALYERRIHLTQELINQYATLSGDFNPLHVNPDYAMNTPFGGTIAHGMLLLGLISALITTVAGTSWITHGRLRVRFRAPAYSGQSVFIRIQQPAQPSTTIWQVALLNETGATLVDGQIEIPSTEKSDL